MPVGECLEFWYPFGSYDLATVFLCCLLLRKGCKYSATSAVIRIVRGRMMQVRPLGKSTVNGLGYDLETRLKLKK